MKKIITQATLAARATSGSKDGKKFYKSYIKNIRGAAARRIEGHVEGYQEKDYTFEYKGKTYRVNQHIVPNKDGEVKYSAEYRFETIEL